MPPDLSSLPQYPTPDHPGAGRDEVPPSIVRSDEPLRQFPTLILYGLALGWMCFAAIPLIYLSFQAGPVAGVGGFLLLGSQV